MLLEGVRPKKGEVLEYWGLLGYPTPLERNPVNKLLNMATRQHVSTHSRLHKVAAWTKNDSCRSSFFLWFGVRKQSRGAQTVGGECEVGVML